MSDNLEKILYRILLGYYYINIDNQSYKILSPSLQIKYDAEILYDNLIEDNKFDKIWLTRKEIEMYLITNGIWNINDDKIIKDLENQIDDIKVDIYIHFFNSTKRKSLVSNLEFAQKNLTKLYAKKQSLDFLSIEEHALNAKNEYMLIKTIYDGANNLVFNINKDIEHNMLQNFIREIVNNSLDTKQIRALAKSEIWRSYSSVCNLQRDIINTSDDYKHLINIHNMYYNVRQHPECPLEDIINDDNALDGWFIQQNRKADKEKKKNAILDKVGGKINDKASHVFIFTNNEEEIQQINDLNDFEQKALKQEVAKYCAANPGTKWEDVPAVKRLQQMEAKKLLDQQIKRK